MKLIKIGIVFVFALGLGLGSAGAKLSFKKDLGIDKCTECHAEGADKKAANPGNALWKTAKEHADKLKAKQGDYAGKATCNDCHQGKRKPAK